jgi:hypothetical protein
MECEKESARLKELVPVAEPEKAMPKDLPESNL